MISVHANECVLCDEVAHKEILFETIRVGI